jgi:phage tail sheath protein FI
MPLNLASPGVLVREVDLTVGRIDPVSPSVGALAAPFAQGPVGEPTLIQNENDLLNTFGKPYNTDKHYEHWMVASSYLAYGGTLQVIRTDDNLMKNAMIGDAASVKIRSLQHYNELNYDENTISNVVFAAKNPGSWGNTLRVAVIDGKADQILTGITTTQVTTFVGVATASDGDLGITTTSVTGITTTGIEIGQVVNAIAGIIDSGTTVSGISTNLSNENVVTFNQATLNTIALDNVKLSFGSNTEVSKSIDVGDGITQSISSTLPEPGTTRVLDGVLKGVVTGIGAGEVYVKVVSHVSAASTETDVDYQNRGVYRFADSGNFNLFEKDTTSSAGTVAYTGETDWFDAQKITLSSGSQVSWSGLAQRPQTSQYAAERGSRFDEVHVVVYDDLGTITGNEGTILEKHLALSKAKDATFSSGSPSYWRKFLAQNSEYVFGGSQPSGVQVVDHQSGKYELVTDTDWDQNAQNVSFSCIGNYHNQMSGGLNYAGISTITTTTALKSGLSDLISAYDIFTNEEDTDVDFLLMGSAAYDIEEAQALANKLIAVAEARQDAIAFISPYRAAAITDTSTQTASTVNNIDTITDNVLKYYSSITSSTYGVLDSGYKYMYDRFNNTFRYVPLNGDIAGTCARTDANSFPWFSPAGTDRGVILNAVKLAYNPGKLQRDKLYSERVNPVITARGQGTILFGDKTAYGKSSAFDRINVRRLFIYLENAISAAARDQLFEFNDELTRTNFVNIVEPFLRDVQSKRGIYDFVVICDQTNNTPAVIDNNEFVADIYIKPAKSINFIGLTFVATRTGVSFEEVIGNV